MCNDGIYIIKLQKIAHLSNRKYYTCYVDLTEMMYQKPSFVTPLHGMSNFLGMTRNYIQQKAL